MSPEATYWQAWREAAQRPVVAKRLRGLLDEIDQAVDGSGFACRQSGQCCRFESFGHRLYMSGLEIAYFRSLVGEARQDTATLPIFDEKQDGCPYQVGGLCSVHVDRPFACRVFFCQEGSDDWHSEQYEAFQAKIKALHDELNLPYQYMEWRTGLAASRTQGL